MKVANQKRPISDILLPRKLTPRGENITPCLVPLLVHFRIVATSTRSEMRPPTACLTCRTRRRKCEATGIGVACSHCSGKGIHCSLGGSSPSTKSRTVKSPPCYRVFSTDDLPVLLPPRALCEELASLYFQYIHDTFHSLFHKPSCMREVSTGTIPRVILFAIISLAARFSNDSIFEGTDPRVRGKVYANEGRRLLDLADVSLTTIQACVLLGACSIVDGDASTEAVYYSIACRMAMLLNLPEMPVATELEREVNIRGTSFCTYLLYKSLAQFSPISFCGFRHLF